jgi:hypothetical protein
VVDKAEHEFMVEMLHQSSRKQPCRVQSRGARSVLSCSDFSPAQQFRVAFPAISGGQM